METSSRRHGMGRVAFLSRLTIVEGRICAGYPLASIYKDFREELGISYSQFSRYVNRYVWNK